uniref:Uncharacterized protein n=1 Tax=Panagrolaimus sp. ES5 TaxID=591445 RepID=A0AC34GMV2_9BILA
MSFIFKSIFLILSVSTVANALLQVEGQNIQGVNETMVDFVDCDNVTTFDEKLLRIDETINKKFIVLLHPNIVDSETAKTFLQSMRCYFGNISFNFVTFNTLNSSENINNGVCEAFDTLSSRSSKALRPLLVVFPPRASKLLLSSNDNNDGNQSNPPCSQFQTNAMTIQATIENDGFVSLFFRSNYADYAIKSVPDCPTLFDSIAVLMNPSLHTEFHFPYRPLQITRPKVVIETEKWHTAAL